MFGEVNLVQDTIDDVEVALMLYADVEHVSMRKQADFLVIMKN